MNFPHDPCIWLPTAQLKTLQEANNSKRIKYCPPEVACVYIRGWGELSGQSVLTSGGHMSSVSPTPTASSLVTSAFSALDNTSTLPNISDQQQEAAVSDQVLKPTQKAIIIAFKVWNVKISAECCWYLYQTVINVRWMLEGLVLPVIGLTGVIGKCGVPSSIIRLILENI